MSGIIDFRTPAAGFDQPIQMWLACHERILRMIALLGRLREHIAAGGAEESARVTAASILRYFDEAAPRHHEDEEIDLFPRMLAGLKGAERDKMTDAIEKLQAEHRLLDDAWAQLRPALVAIEAGADFSMPDQSALQFVGLYRQHVEQENTVLLPAFERSFDPPELAEIGRAMAARRGVDWETLSAKK